MPDANSELVIGGERIARGVRARIGIRMARLPNATDVAIETTVIHGAKPGPRLWLSAAIHGDEINGIEVIRHVLEKLDPKTLRGTVIAIPIVNVFGFLHQSRYLPDRRDLNRSFPGSKRGSMASRMANLFMQEVVSQCTHGIDLHTAAQNRDNLPQIRADLEDAETLSLARAFAAPVLLHSRTRDGSLRAAATERGVKVLLYEAGEAHRFDERAISIGARGVRQVMARLGMTRHRSGEPQRSRFEISRSRWVRAHAGGLLRLEVRLAQVVSKGERLGFVAGTLGEDPAIVKAPFDGVVIGATRNPIVYQGDGLLNLGQLGGADPVDDE